MVLKVTSGLGTRSDLLMLAIMLSQLLRGEHSLRTLLRTLAGYTPVPAEVWCCDRLRVCGELMSDARGKERCAVFSQTAQYDDTIYLAVMG
jgi:hypothetical protein